MHAFAHPSMRRFGEFSSKQASFVKGAHHTSYATTVTDVRQIYIR
jgi:hypothetical protein